MNLKSFAALSLDSLEKGGKGDHSEDAPKLSLSLSHPEKRAGI